MKQDELGAGHRPRWPASGMLPLVGLALLLSAVPPAAAQEEPATVEGISVQLLDMPASGRGDPRAERYIVDNVAPGTTFTRRFRVTNAMRTATDLSLYPVAAEIVDGAFVVLGGHAENELTRWITLSPESLRLAAGESAEVTVTVAVPEDATNGERYAVALAERAAGPAGSGGLAVVSRIGIRLYLSVSGGAEPPTDFEIPSLRAGRDDAGNPHVTATVRNVGERAIDVSGRLALTDGPGRLRAGPFPVETVTALAPGDEQEVAFALDSVLPDGPWTAHVEMRSGRERRLATAVITFPAPGTSGLQVPATVPSGAPVPLVASAAALVLAAAGLTWRFSFRLRRR